jgi:hypothetical protein
MASPRRIAKAAVALLAIGASLLLGEILLNGKVSAFPRSSTARSVGGQKSDLVQYLKSL